MISKKVRVAWLYLASAGVSLVGNSVATIVWPWLILQRTGDPAAAGFVATAIAVPSLIFALVGGYFIDKFGRKLMSVISDVISGLSIIAVIIIDSWWGLNLTWFVIIGIVGAVGDIPGMAARAALVGEVAYTSGKKVDFLSGIYQTLVGITYLAGPPLAGYLMSVLPLQNVLWITAICSLLAALLTALLRLHKVPAGAHIDVPDDKRVSFNDWRAWISVLRVAPIRLLVLVSSLSATLIGPYLVLLVPAHFQSVNNSQKMGWVFASWAVGMIVGGGLITMVGTHKRRLLWGVSMVLFTVGYAGMAMLDSSWPILIGSLLSGIANGLISPLQMVLIVEKIPENVRGRAFSLFNAIEQLAMPLGFMLATVALTQTSIYAVAIVEAMIWTAMVIYIIPRGCMVLEDKKPEAKPVEII